MENWKAVGAILSGIAALLTAISAFKTKDLIPLQYKTVPSTTLSHTKTATVSDPDGWTNLRQLPSTEAKILTRLSNDTVVSVLNRSGNWYQIQTKQNIVGFVYRDNILFQ